MAKQRKAACPIDRRLTVLTIPHFSGRRKNTMQLAAILQALLALRRWISPGLPKGFVFFFFLIIIIINVML